MESNSIEGHLNLKARPGTQPESPGGIQQPGKAGTTASRMTWRRRAHRGKAQVSGEEASGNGSERYWCLLVLECVPRWCL